MDSTTTIESPSTADPSIPRRNIVLAADSGQEQPPSDAVDLDEFDSEADQAEFHDKAKWKDLSGAEKDRILTKYAHKSLSRLQAEGRIVRLNGQIVLVTKTEQWVIDRNSIKVNDALYRATKTTSSNYWSRQIIDRVLIEAGRIAEKIKFGRYVVINPSSFVVTAANGIFEVSAGIIKPVDPKDYFFKPIGKPWTYIQLSDTERVEAGRSLKRLLADSQAIDPRSRMSLAIAQVGFPFIRSWMPTRPIFPGLSNQGGEGKSFGKDRFSYLLYGQSGLKTASEPALRRAVDPLVILDDQDDLANDLLLYMKRGVTGSRHQSVTRSSNGFEVEESSQADSIFIFTSTRLPKDSPFLSRFWPSTYDKRWFSSDFRSEGRTQSEILVARDHLLSLMLDVLAEALKDPMPDLDGYGELPYPRTYEAFQWLLRLLTAFDRRVPGVINPQAEFNDFLSVLREEKDGTGLATDELTLLDRVFETVEADTNAYVDEGLRFDEGCLTGTATAFSTVLSKEATRQGKRLNNFTGNNVGRWLAGDVNSSKEFVAERDAIGSGNQRRRIWKVQRRETPET